MHCVLEKYQQLLDPPLHVLKEIEDEFTEELTKGLERDDAQLMMLPTYVVKLPDGQEAGEVYAIDLGGTNFRVLYSRLSEEPRKVDSTELFEVAIPNHIYTGSGTQLFDFMAAALTEFIRRHANERPALVDDTGPLVGFCFSYAMDQKALDSGLLKVWTKGFMCDGVLGEDVMRLMREAMARAGQPCRMTAIMNDTVGVLAAARYLHPDTLVGVIVGTGTNAAYVERACALKKWTPPAGTPPDALTMVNIEWGSLAVEALPRTIEDLAADKDSCDPGQYWFEKMVSGLYLGDVARRIIVTLTEQHNLFGPGGVPSALRGSDGFRSAELAAIVDDTSLTWSVVTRVMVGRLGLQPHRCTWVARQAVRRVCAMVARRSARVVAAGLAGLLRHLASSGLPPHFTIAVDGGVYEKFATYRTMLRNALADALGTDAARIMPRVQFQGVFSGSCLGAGVLAAAAAQS